MSPCLAALLAVALVVFLGFGAFAPLIMWDAPTSSLLEAFAVSATKVRPHFWRLAALLAIGVAASSLFQKVIDTSLPGGKSAG